MGGVKRAHEEAMDRGWNDIDKFVCVSCVEDEHLQQLITSSLTGEGCDYCDSSSQEIMAAPVEAIMEAVSGTLKTYYNSIEASGFPRGDGYRIEDWVTTEQALYSLPFDVNSALFSDVVNSFVNQSWIETANGWWGSSHQSVILENAWQRFSIEVKEKSRYFFSQPENKADPFLDHENISALSLMDAIGKGSEDLGLITPLIMNSRYYRVRSGPGYFKYSDIGPPGVGVAGSGRMNPEGISYFYLADNELTAIVETRLSDGEEASLATFEISSELKVLDFTQTMQEPPKFAPNSYYLSEMIKFLREFVSQIRKPVGKASSLEYIPTQVLSEYFAKVFRCEDGSKIDGFIYSSATSSIGNNLVLFPESHASNGWERVAALKDAQNIMVRSSVDGFETI